MQLHCSVLYGDSQGKKKKKSLDTKSETQLPKAVSSAGAIHHQGRRARPLFFFFFFFFFHGPKLSPCPCTSPFSLHLPGDDNTFHTVLFWTIRKLHPLCSERGGGEGGGKRKKKKESNGQNDGEDRRQIALYRFLRVRGARG